MKAIIYSILSSVLICGCFCKTASAQSKEEPFGNANTKVVELKVTGMTCQGCSEHVNHALDAVPGVLEHITSYEQGTSLVKFDAAKATKENLVQAVNATGYTVTETKELGK